MTAKIKNLSFYAIALGLTVLDQVTKDLARIYLHDGKPVSVIPGFFDLQLSFNNGAAFGIMPNWAPMFILIALAAIFAIVKLRGNENQPKALSIGLALLLGGALGNLIDRIASSHHEVTDFLSVHVNLSGNVYAWPTFNVADAAVVIGAILMIFHVYVLEKRRIETS
ncbi:MAG: signal peptidase II [Armatimonadetes bacterium]|nr:signal peptidase II [Armatimonadota bacterium]